MVGSAPIKLNKGMIFDAVPEDKYQVQVTDVTAVVALNTYKGVEEEKLKFEFTILDEDKTMISKDDFGKEAESKLRGRKLWARFSKNLSVANGRLSVTGKASNLSKLLMAIYGRPLEEPELEVWEPEDTMGKQVCVMVNQTPDGKGNIWNNCVSFSPIKKEMTPVEKNAKESSTKKSTPAVADNGEDFEQEMDKVAAKRAKS